MEYDIIGDVHGCYSLLIKLLERLSYQEIDSVWQHASRKAIFLGDLINRGENSRAVLHLVKRMHDAGKAEVILGNHELNFIGWYTQREDGSYLRSHNSHNLKQVEKTLDDFEAYPEEIPDFIAWMRTLPIYIDHEQFRVIHACWDQSYIDLIEKGQFENNLLDDHFLEESFTPGTLAFNTIERLLKGVEYRLPKGMSFRDNDGKTRYYVRIKWWNKHPKATIKDISIVQFEEGNDIPNNTEFIERLPEYKDSKPLFLGHYCLRDEKTSLLSKNIVCLDYCSYRMNRLTAYQFNGRLLTTHQIVQVMEQ
jgi:hypothetical protein